MFVESLVESTPLLRSRSRMPALISVATQCALVALLVAIPLLHPEVLHPAALRLSAIAPPPLPAPKPPPLPRPQVVTAVETSAPSVPDAPTRPMSAAQQAFKSDAPGVDAPALAFGSPMGTVSPALIGSSTTSPTVVVRPAASSTPTRISQGVIAGLLLAPIQPIYPPIARATGTQGTVVVEAIISKSGRIESARTISGPVMLQSAALDAVRNARYHPYLLNGEPTEVETTISINFKMN